MAIQRIKERQETHRLGRLRLYRDDLEAMAEALAEFGDLEFTVNDELTGTEPGDFASMRDELPERLERVRMEAKKGEAAIRVELGSGAKAVLIEPDPAARGTLASVREAGAPLRMGKGQVFILAAGVAILATLAIFYFAYASDEAANSLEALSWAASVGSVGAMGVGLSAAAFRSWGENSDSTDVILNVPRAERPTFRQRLVADGGVSAFWTVVGLVCGGAIGYLVNQLPGL